jgi:hypothetical protein
VTNQEPTRRRPARMRPERRIAIVREILLLIVGIAGIGYQTIIGPVNVPLLLIFMAMTGLPGLTNILAILQNSSSVLQSLSGQQSESPGESENSSIAGAANDQSR